MTMRNRDGRLSGHARRACLAAALCAGACNDDGSPSDGDGTVSGQDDDDDDGESTFATITVGTTVSTTECPSGSCTDVTTDPTITTDPTMTTVDPDTGTTGEVPGWPDPGAFGDDTITGFDINPTGGQDVLNLTALGLTAGQVTIAAGPVAGSTLITIAGGLGTITLLGVTPATVTIGADIILA